MFIEERHQAILDSIKENGRILIAEIQDKYDVSVDSARRDLRILESKGLLKRTHGGAISALKVGYKCLDKCTVRDMTEINPLYDAVAKKACEFICEGDTIHISSGSVGYLMLKHLPENINFTVVTNSIIIADEIRTRDKTTIYLIGGKMRDSGVCVDALATESIRKMKMDKSFISGAGFSSKFGLSNSTPETVAYQNAVIESSREKIILAPSPKVGFDAFLKVADASRFDVLITDWEALDEELERIRESGVDVVVADQIKESSVKE